MILCDAHPSRDVDYYCTQEKEFICNKCALIKHSAHMESLKEVAREEVDNHCEKLLTYLELMRNRITQAHEKV